MLWGKWSLRHAMVLPPSCIEDSARFGAEDRNASVSCVLSHQFTLFLTLAKFLQVLPYHTLYSFTGYYMWLFLYISLKTLMKPHFLPKTFLMPHCHQSGPPLPCQLSPSEPCSDVSCNDSFGCLSPLQLLSSLRTVPFILEIPARSRILGIQ